MERVTFPNEEVKRLFSGLVPVKLDIDLEATAIARERFKEPGGVPAFVLVDAEGALLWRATGGRPADTLVREVRAALEAGPPPAPPAGSCFPCGFPFVTGGVAMFGCAAAPRVQYAARKPRARAPGAEKDDDMEPERNRGGRAA